MNPDTYSSLRVLPYLMLLAGWPIHAATADKANTHNASDRVSGEYQAAQSVVNGIRNGQMSSQTDLNQAKQVADQQIQGLQDLMKTNAGADQVKYRAECQKAINKWKEVKASAASGGTSGTSGSTGSLTSPAQALQGMANAMDRELAKTPAKIAAAREHYAGERDRIRGKFDALHNDLESKLRGIEAAERGGSGKSRYTGPSAADIAAQAALDAKANALRKDIIFDMTTPGALQRDTGDTNFIYTANKGDALDQAMQNPDSFQPGSATKDYPESFDTTIDGKAMPLPQGIDLSNPGSGLQPGQPGGSADAALNNKETAKNSGTEAAPAGSDASKPGYNEAIEKMRADDAALAAKVAAEKNGTPTSATSGIGTTATQAIMPGNNPTNANGGQTAVQPGTSALASPIGAANGGQFTNGTGPNPPAMSGTAATISPGSGAADAATAKYTSPDGTLGGAINTKGDVTVTVGSGKMPDGAGGYTRATNEISGSQTINPKSGTTATSVNVRAGDTTLGVNTSSGPGTQTSGLNVGIGWWNLGVSKTTKGNTDTLTGSFTAEANVPGTGEALRVGSTTTASATFEAHPKGGTYDPIQNTEVYGFKSVGVSGTETLTLKTPIGEVPMTYKVDAELPKANVMIGATYDHGKLMWEDESGPLVGEEKRSSYNKRINGLKSLLPGYSKQDQEKAKQEIAERQHWLDITK